MSLELPKVIGKYLRASNDEDLESFLACFSETATVLDEGKSISGHEALGKWFIKTRKEYQFKSEPIGIEGEGENLILTAKVSGNFPGSPLNLNYHIKCKSELIQDLKIV